MTAEEYIQAHCPEMLARRTVDGMADHPWHTWGNSRPWNPAVYPFGIMCSGCGLGMDKHPHDPGYLGYYDSAQA